MDRLNWRENLKIFLLTLKNAYLVNKKMISQSRLYGGELTQIHIKRAIKILLPREYFSRERFYRHIATNFLPGLMPITKNHNAQKYCFSIVHLSSEPQVIKFILLEDNWKTITLPLPSDQNIKRRAILFVENETLLVLIAIRLSKLLNG